MSEPLRALRYELYRTGSAELLESYTTAMDEHLDWVPEPAVRPDGYPFGYEWRVFTDTGKHVYTNSFAVRTTPGAPDAD